MDTVQILLITFGAGGLLMLLALAFGGPSPAKEGARRLQSVRFRHSESATDKVEAQMRRALAQRRPMISNDGSPRSQLEMLALRLHRAGKTWTVQQYLQASGGLMAVVSLLLWLKTGSLMLALMVGLLVGAGVPHMVVGYLIRKRYDDFTAKFPDAIELLVRGLRSGLPVTETLGIVSAEVPGPVGQEFKLVTERIKIGRGMDEALQDTADRLNMAEFNFFCITIAIQRETGGNLAETLGNLADVLRKRAQMKLKIRAMSSESKASAYIVGSLPFMVFLMINWVNPQYLAGFFSDDRLIITGLGGLTWMAIGVFIMAKMVSFEI
ncbi:MULTISPECIES: type II secretion system F family protein [Novosphingobium]|uniref:type II secretion system F family protein n=1 Tax=Novosphingobium TaxID=165696 RepID=UPI00086E79D1|nr:MULTISPECIES: type II secretion system F family protein [Novosphingobium]MBN9145266.1 type II secretion system F family protein [Novosphingobium sp.]MDR6709645.1 tight adherence protein B [Novosphingobium sp. 1748]ODU80351.1 MAG: pilus assembly protein TadB [Novosphingobium sp. SCN 63-17]OJX88711.1 MAG: pilus assembly protein TadB [Novosphingobium sp. 63-713]WJS98456.1 type II secretion system F family protein [Novosphingobium humi]